MTKKNKSYLVVMLLMLAGGISACVAPTAVGRPKASQNFMSAVSGRVIIDPGHGGEDSGAVGPTGLKEKDLTLDMALRIRRLLRRHMPNVEVVLTRSGDRYVSLEERVKTANTLGGDLFLSLHINSSESQDASGFELYSLDVASNSHADRLAARENKSTQVSSKALKFILADLRANSNRERSDQLAGLISRGLNAQLSKVIPSAKLNDRGYNQALFHVLFVKMPAVLSELFFISSPEEERWLATSKVREFGARGMVVGIMHFLENRVIRAQK